MQNIIKLLYSIGDMHIPWLGKQLVHYAKDCISFFTPKGFVFMLIAFREI